MPVIYTQIIINLGDKINYLHQNSLLNLRINPLIYTRIFIKSYAKLPMSCLTLNMGIDLVTYAQISLNL